MRHASALRKYIFTKCIYSNIQRKGTVADKMKEQVADTVKSERSAVLFAFEKAQSLQYRKMYIGKRLEFLLRN